MQNSIIREFENNSDVVAVILNQGNGGGESAEWLQLLWSQYFLRGGILFDETGTTSLDFYDVPQSGLPFGKNFIIDQDGNVASANFGYNPKLAIDTIYDLLGTQTDVSKNEATIPLEFQLDQNYPNPFNPATTIRFSLPAASHVSLKIYNIKGQLMTTLVDEQLSQGNHTFQWQAANMASGTYFYTLTNNSFSETKRMILLK